jgi:hypothetical protein
VCFKGDAMKVYIAGDSSELVIAAANMVNNSGNSGIVSEAKKADYGNLISDVGAKADDYDMIVFFSRKPLDACADINKMEAARAVVCDSEKDIERIRASGRFNIVVIDSTAIAKRDLSEILGELTAPKGGEQGQGAEEEPAARFQKKKPDIGEGLRMIAGRARQHWNEEQRNGDESADGRNDGPSFTSKVKKKGLMGALKDELGME